MRLCTCAHDESAHSEEGQGYCFANKPNGDPCDCERFTVDAAAPEISEDPEGSHYIGQGEKESIEQSLLRSVALALTSGREIPDIVVMNLVNRECGPQRAIVFELTLFLWPWATPDRVLFYHADGPFEFAGVPEQCWMVPL